MTDKAAATQKTSETKSFFKVQADKVKKTTKALILSLKGIFLPVLKQLIERWPV